MKHDFAFLDVLRGFPFDFIWRDHFEVQSVLFAFYAGALPLKSHLKLFLSGAQTMLILHPFL